MASDLPKEFTPPQLAKAIGMERSTVRKWAASGKIPAKKVGRNWRILASDLRVECPDIWFYLLERL